MKAAAFVVILEFYFDFYKETAACVQKFFQGIFVKEKDIKLENKSAV